MQQLDDCVSYFSRLFLNDFPATCWIAGGSLRDYFSLGHCMTDVDVFFPNEEELKKVEQFFKDKKIVCTFENDRVANYVYKKHLVQLIKAYYFEGPREAIGQFDFTVACCAVDKKEVYYHESFFIDLARKRIVINALPFPLSTLQRLQKYIKKGYTICNKRLLEISKGIQTLNLESPADNTFEFYSDGQLRFMRID